MNRNLVISADGSHTIYNQIIDEHYHSSFGAITESTHIFIENGLNQVHSESIRILEIGFGTGLNALLAMNYGIIKSRIIYYETVELFPLEMSIINQLNYVKTVNTELFEQFEKMHTIPWNTLQELSKTFSIKKINASAISFEPSGNFDVVFYDAFSPEKQPELWSKEIFEKMYNAMNAGGVLTTYCAKGIVKRALKEVGFKVEVIPGPPGKRHMVRARKNY
jgi:tRNA U34 5-methylaminomethyl-2-thiouridine-forming methyltransferase MnmC